MVRKSRVNRKKELLRIQKNAKGKRSFTIKKTSNTFAGQAIQLYNKNFENNIQAQHMKEFEPKQYIQQRLKLKGLQNRQKVQLEREAAKTLSNSSAYWLKELNKNYE